mgnify:CR=1 FL=1
MILEVAILQIKAGMVEAFQGNFEKAAPIISSVKGYLGHELKKCLENPNQFLLLVRWETLEDHEEGFRKSEEYKEWKRLLHHFYEPFPEVLHYR